MKNHKILDETLALIDSMLEAAVFLTGKKNSTDYKEINEVLSDLKVAIDFNAINCKALKESFPFVQADLTSENICYSIQNIERLFIMKAERFFDKIEYELIPLLAELYYDLHFFGHIYGNREAEKVFYEKELAELTMNPYIERSHREASYKYEVSIIVSGFNEVKYTKTCIESIIKTVPRNLDYELILLNNGSNDGTEEYFDSLNCKKVINLKKNTINNVVLPLRIIEGKYYLGVSNDVVVTENAIENLLECIKSDSNIARVVAATSNVSNFQTLEADYHSLDELDAFARKNNISDSRRWEQRIRLCDPININRSFLAVSSKGIHLPDKVWWTNGFFNDDAAALEYRRRGYKLILAKDSYCHHFGSVTYKNDYKEPNEMNRELTIGREAFRRRYGVDPYSHGFCYNYQISTRLTNKNKDSISILSINPGFGSNPLKIKEVCKEQGSNKIELKIFSTDDRFEGDWTGFADETKILKDIKSISNMVEENTYDFICVEQFKYSSNKDTQYLKNIAKGLTEDGTFLMNFDKADLSKVKNFIHKAEYIEENGETWVICGKDGCNE